MLSVFKTSNKKYPWRYHRGVVHHVKGLDPTIKVNLVGKYGIVYAQIHWAHLFIFKGYAYDGCTWAPDLYGAIESCGAHDALMQILDKNPDLFPEQLAHDLMLSIQRQKAFWLAPLYFWAVSGFPRKIYKFLTR